MKEQIAGAVYAPSVAPSWYCTQAAALIAIVASALAAADLIEFELVEVAHRIGIHIKLSFPCSLREICKFAASLQVQKAKAGMAYRRSMKLLFDICFRNLTEAEFYSLKTDKDEFK